MFHDPLPGDIRQGVGFIRPEGRQGTILIAVFANDDEAFLIGTIGLVKDGDKGGSGAPPGSWREYRGND